MSGIVPIFVFAGIASPAMFQITRRYAGNWVATPEGLATVPGLLLHGIVFVIIMSIFMMIFGRSSGYLMEGGMKFETRDDQDDQNTTHYQQSRFID